MRLTVVVVSGAPNGPIVAAQVDNEMSHFFRTAAYDQDYHPDAIVLYRRFIAERYGDDLPVGYGSELDAIEPPRAMTAKTVEDLLPHLVLFVLFRPAPISVIPATSGITQSAERHL